MGRPPDCWNLEEVVDPTLPLVPDVQDALITRFVDNTVRPDGFSMQTFMRAVMALTLEGYLGDPRHGGNAGGVGWRVVGFAPEGRAQGLALQVLPVERTNTRFRLSVGSA